MLLCNFCSDSPKVATIACENCSYYYCSACVKRFHPKVGPLKSHNLINDHASHSLEDIEKAFEKSKNCLQELSDQLNQHITHSNQVKQETEEHIHRLKNEGRAAEKKIRMEAEFLRSTVSGGEKTMIQTVQLLLREKVTSLQEALEEIPRLTTSSMRVLNDLSGILKNSSFMHVLSKFGELNSRAQSQLDLLNSVERRSEVQLGFDYDNFTCSDVVNAIADKLTIPSSNPHALMFAATSCSNPDHYRSLDDEPGTSPPQHDDTNTGNLTQAWSSLPRGFKKLDLSSSSLARAVTKHPEFLHHGVSVSDLLSKHNRLVPEQAIENPNQDCAGGEHYRIAEMSSSTDAKKSRVHRLEEIWHRKTSEQREAVSTLSERTTLTTRLPSSDGFVPAAQRAKDRYYSAYQLTSERSDREDNSAADEKSQLTNIASEGEMSQCKLCE